MPRKNVLSSTLDEGQTSVCARVCVSVFVHVFKCVCMHMYEYVSVCGIHYQCVGVCERVLGLVSWTCMCM